MGYLSGESTQGYLEAEAVSRCDGLKGLSHLKYRVARALEESYAENTADVVAFDAEKYEVDWPPEIRKPVRHTANLIRDDVENIVNGEGWKALEKKVNRSSLGWTNWCP